MRAFDRSASAISSATAQASARASNAAVSGPDLIESVISVRVAANDVKANIAVVRTADEMLGTLLDLQA